MAVEAGGSYQLLVVCFSLASDETVRTVCPVDSGRSRRGAVAGALRREPVRSNVENESAEEARHALGAPGERNLVTTHTRAHPIGHLGDTVLLPRSGRRAVDARARSAAKHRCPTPPGRSRADSSR